ncbi:MAG: type II secretion system F family protein [Clostridia bacterium]|nr:type II secretion system F family protein [Clostridia bacterium]
MINFYMVLLCQILATLLLLFFIMAEKNNSNQIKTEEKIFLLRDSFFIGDFLINRLEKTFIIQALIKLNFNFLTDTLSADEKKQKAKTIAAAQLSYLLIFLYLSLQVAALSENYKVIFYINIVSIFLCLYISLYFNLEKKRLADEIYSQLPSIYLKFTLLLGSGIILKEAWKEVAYSSQGQFYKLMQKTDREIENGKSFTKALEDLSKNTSNHEVKKFVFLILENLKKGGDNLRETFLMTSGENFELKKQRAKKKAIIADQKLLYPIILMFSGIIFMIIVPLFSDIVK